MTDAIIANAHTIIRNVHDWANDRIRVGITGEETAVEAGVATVGQNTINENSEVLVAANTSRKAGVGVWNYSGSDAFLNAGSAADDQDIPVV